MSQLLIFWIATGVFFIIIELFTVTLYGFCISIAAFVVAAYVWFTKDTSITIPQTLIFVGVSVVLSYFVPKYFKSNSTSRSDNPLEVKHGEIFVLKQSKGEYRINVEGVNYLVKDSCVTKDFADGKKVILKAHSGTQVIVEVLTN
jgi:membrane protein implicated in regulation of membrane protease activity